MEIIWMNLHICGMNVSFNCLGVVREVCGVIHDFSRACILWTQDKDRPTCLFNCLNCFCKVRMQSNYLYVVKGCIMTKYYYMNIAYRAKKIYNVKIVYAVRVIYYVNIAHGVGIILSCEYAYEAGN